VLNHQRVEMKKILMFGRPGGTLAFTFDQHVLALNSDLEKRFSVEVARDQMSYQEISQFDILWFYAKAFSPNVYENLYKNFGNKKFIVGPNVLLDKPDIGISDQWDNWLINYANYDLQLDQVQFYNDHVKKFLPDHKKNVSTYVDKCMRLDIFDKDIGEFERKIDCLVYTKKRRYDVHFDSFRNEIISGLANRGLQFEEIIYGNYKKIDFLEKLLKTKVMINLSLDECPGILNYEAFYCNVHVIGSPHNVPSHYDESLHVKNSDEMTEKYLVRKPEASRLYLEKVDWFFSDYLSQKTPSPRDYVLHHTSYQKYCNEMHNIFEKYLYYK
tara:strand:+ start:358 stop:1341 length:984 start_codon:yes stop_codon:yes gene_type:complete